MKYPLIIASCFILGGCAAKHPIPQKGPTLWHSYQAASTPAKPPRLLLSQAKPPIRTVHFKPLPNPIVTVEIFPHASQDSAGNIMPLSGYHTAFTLYQEPQIVLHETKTTKNR